MDEYDKKIRKWNKLQINTYYISMYKNRRKTEQIYNLERRIQHAGTQTLNFAVCSENNIMESLKQQAKLDIAIQNYNRTPDFRHF